MENRTMGNVNMDSDFDSFRKLCVMSFGNDINQDKDMYEWLFNQNPYNSGVENMMYVMKEDDKIIATNGLIPSELNLNGNKVSMAHSVRSMTHKDYEGRGLFRQMADNYVTQGRGNGLDVIIGFANKRSYPAFKKFGWISLFQKETLFKRINIYNKLKSRFKIGIISHLGNVLYKDIDIIRCSAKKAHNGTDKYMPREFDKVPKEVECVWEKYRDKYGACICRDYKYLNYRYNMRPDVKYKTVMFKENDSCIGYIIFRETTKNSYKTVSVTELFTDPESKVYISLLVDYITKYARNVKADYVVISCGPAGLYKEVLSAYGFIKNEQFTFTVAKILSDNVSEDDIKSEKWHISQGDGESELSM